jgi:hypothetical protein
MDNFANKPPGNDDLDEPIPLDDDIEKPIPFDDAPEKPTSPKDDSGGASVSHSPLDLGGGGTAQPATPAPKKTAPAKPAQKSNPAKTASTDRITGVKTFFTKLHPGAMQFLDEQINSWLQQNPDIHIRRTDTTTGQVQAKKTEPNIIITVWY